MSHQTATFPKLARPNILTILIFAIALLHLLRNISYIYFFIYGFFSLIAIAISISKNNHIKSRKTFLLVVCGFSLYIVCISLLQSENYQYFGPAYTGIFRYFFIAPVVFCVCANVDIKSANWFFGAWLAFAVASALSLPVQFIIGPIGWFSESFERAGVDRFGSLAGSLTSFGNISGAAAFLAFVMPRRTLVSVALILIIIIGSILSLQKAAIASLFIGISTGILMRGLNIQSLKILLYVSFITIFSMLLLIDDYIAGILYTIVETFTGTVDDRLASDVSFVQSVIDRSSDLPSIAIGFHGWERLILGAGVFGGSGGLGYSEIPHPHNLFVENIIIFGWVGGMACAILILHIFIRSIGVFFDKTRPPYSSEKISAGVLINLIIPTSFAGALFFHPAAGVIFWLSVILIFSPLRADKDLVD